MAISATFTDSLNFKKLHVTDKVVCLLVLSRHSLLPILLFARSIMSDNQMRFFKSDCKDISIFI